MIEFGKTGMKVNRLGFGGIPIQRIDQNGANELLKFIKESGINFLDTARAYGESETYIGEAIKEMRDSFYLATKSMARDYEGMKADIEKSLSCLQTDHIDLYQIHNVQVLEIENLMSQDGAYRALLEARDQGKIKNIGITTHTLESLEKIVEMGTDYFMSIQFPFNIVESQGTDLLTKAHEKGMGTIIMKPLAGGAIEDPELAVRYILDQNFTDIVIPGMGDIEEVKQNIQSAKAVLEAEKHEFTQEELVKIEEIKKDLTGNFCRRCGYCKPCPQGIDIPLAFLSARYMKRYNLAQWGYGRYMASNLEKDGEFACVKCGACLPKCPYFLPIPDMLEEVYKTKLETDKSRRQEV
ncbi:aldo/keto reductase [Proteocatella sphenisci]|uniref:aldo/keto reductase n=1 Tax=Proteocatella sphenisci TaxID=181070 RepID=UPI00048F953D|nr:aldo/keto reductase [Proteocatella sphenisci]